MAIPGEQAEMKNHEPTPTAAAHATRATHTKPSGSSVRASSIESPMTNAETTSAKARRFVASSNRFMIGSKPVGCTAIRNSP